jgi:hypothetical protein
MRPAVRRDVQVAAALATLAALATGAVTATVRLIGGAS